MDPLEKFYYLQFYFFIISPFRHFAISCFKHAHLRVIEVRCVEGYGARWSHDGSAFRGFLEPQIEDGHAAGWKR